MFKEKSKNSMLRDSNFSVDSIKPEVQVFLAEKVISGIGCII